MGLITTFLDFFRVNDPVPRQELRRVSLLEPEQAASEMGTIFYDLCDKFASRFVSEELQKKDSPFNGLSRFVFFHEIIVLNFWALDKIFGGKKKDLLSHVHSNYFRSFHFEGSAEERTKTLSEKYREYYASWDDHTGHQDEFGLSASKMIFGEGKNDRQREKSFWIISYADSTIKDLQKVKKSCKELGLYDKF